MGLPPLISENLIHQNFPLQNLQNLLLFVLIINIFITIQISYIIVISCSKSSSFTILISEVLVGLFFYFSINARLPRGHSLLLALRNPIYHHLLVPSHLLLLFLYQKMPCLLLFFSFKARKASIGSISIFSSSSKSSSFSLPRSSSL